ncbi:MAG: toxin [Campylobacterota bacterium]|nr:toxin [Campylobacterota bacterium]
MIRVEWDNEKNETLKQTRGICFEDVERTILEDKLLDIVPHFNKKYLHQEIMVVFLNNYIHYVPFVQDEEKIFLKTIVPSRKLNKMYNTKD